MSNKISLRRIKSFLSLRGAKRRSNLNFSGFSLIELMVAVVILAMVIFGIFLAFTTGFQGMADARDRTVATNYLREAMEDIKNMDFEKIATTTRSVTDGNRKYRIDVNLIEASDTFKKIYTVVSWIDRNGETKTIDSSLTVNLTEIFASDAAKIVLFADSYNIINDHLSEYSSTDIIAVIKDINGNTITDWEEGDITFEIISSTPLFGEFAGGLSIIDVPTVEGRASITFFSKGTFVAASAPTDDYYVLQKIKASVTIPDVGEVTDTTTIKITDGPVKIIINDPKPNPESLEAVMGNYSTITASVINAAGDVLLIQDIFKTIEITFIASGEGKFENDSSIYTITIPWDSGSEEPATVTVKLYSTDEPGLVNILATSPNLASGSANVIFLGQPVAISISAKPNPIYETDTEGSTISVSLLDSNGYSTNPTDNPITVSLDLTDNGTGGDIVDSLLTFNVDDIEMIKTTKFSGQNSTGTARIDASAVGLTGEYYVTITVVSSLVPDHIELEVMGDNNIPADGITTAIIKATVYDESDKVVTSYPGTITFNITGTGNFSNFNFINGIATIEISSSAPGTATITVTSSDSLPSDPVEGVEVKFYGTADHIKLEANKSMVKIGGTEFSTITATVCDEKGSTIEDYIGTITFDTTLGNFSNYSFENGVATTELSSIDPGTAIVTVSSSDSLPYEPEEPLEVEFYEETTLEYVEGTIQYADIEKKIITFYVKVTGENIVVDAMKIKWTNSHQSQKISKIEIVDLEVWNGNQKSDVEINFTSDPTLIPGETKISLTFGQDMTGKYPIEVIFYPPFSGQYIINLLSEPS